jgi:hypothetical protein
VAKWAFIRVAVHATVGPWSNQVVPDLTVLDALQRWDEQAVTDDARPTR